MHSTKMLVVMTIFKIKEAALEFAEAVRYDKFTDSAGNWLDKK